MLADEKLCLPASLCMGRLELWSGHASCFDAEDSLAHRDAQIYDPSSTPCRAFGAESTPSLSSSRKALRSLRARSRGDIRGVGADHIRWRICATKIAVSFDISAESLAAKDFEKTSLGPKRSGMYWQLYAIAVVVVLWYLGSKCLLEVLFVFQTSAASVRLAACLAAFET